MPEDEIYQRITPIFRDIFDDDDIELRSEMTASDVDEWDSLSHIRLIVGIERALGVQFTTTEINNLENVGQFVSLIGQKLQGGG